MIPRCMGGTNELSNIVALTGREHWFAHKLLVKIHPENRKLIFAAVWMARKSANGRAFEWLRKHYAKMVGDSRRGQKASDELRHKLSLAQRGRKHRPETIAKLSALKMGNKGRLGKPLTQEHKARLSAALIGRPLSAECRAKLSIARKGQRPSDETRAKLSAARIGKKRSPESVAKTASWHLGRKRPPFSAEWRAKLAAASRGNKSNLGRTLSPEHRAKIAAGTRAAFAQIPYRLRAASRLGLTLSAGAAP